MYSWRRTEGFGVSKIFVGVSGGGGEGGLGVDNLSQCGLHNLCFMLCLTPLPNLTVLPPLVLSEDVLRSLHCSL